MCSRLLCCLGSANAPVDSEQTADEKKKDADLSGVGEQVKHLAFIGCKTNPAAVALELAMEHKAVPHIKFAVPGSCKDEWLLRLSPDGNLPALGSLANADSPKEEVAKISGLNDSHGANMKEMAAYLDRCYSGAKLMPQTSGFDEAMLLIEELAQSIPMICFAPKPSVQGEKRKQAVAALTKLDKMLESSQTKFVLGTEGATLIDFLLASWLNRYTILIRYRSWTPETPPGKRSEESPPSSRESRLPHIAKFREDVMPQWQSKLLSEEAALTFAKTMLKRPSPLGSGKLEHESLRFHFASVKGLLGKLTENPNDQIACDKLVQTWNMLYEFTVAHSNMEDNCMYKYLEEIEPGCTKRASGEHESEVPPMKDLIPKLDELAKKADRSAGDVAAIKAGLGKVLESMENHLVGEETQLMTIQEKIPPEKHSALFPEVWASYDQWRSNIYAFILDGMSLSEGEQYLRNFLDHGKSPNLEEEVKTLWSYMIRFQDKGILPPERASKLVERVPELAALPKELLGASGPTR